ncbi:MAG: hypothetical protein CM15mP14_4740 [Rhodospirillaceae bacterium]|nr:MAG: hypothetical protein CM15mP14_4740 [Rhodospirillaceae bacterium]
MKVNNKSANRIKLISLRLSLGFFVVYNLGGMTVNRPNNATIKLRQISLTKIKKFRLKFLASNILYKKTKSEENAYCKRKYNGDSKDCRAEMLTKEY